MQKSDWKKCKLWDALNFHRGYDLPKDQMTGQGYPVVGSNGIIGYHDEYTTSAPCLVIGRSGNTGKPAIYNYPCWAHNTTLYVDDFKGNSPQFLCYLLKTMDLGSYAAGSAVPTLNRNHIHPLEINLPPIEEQKRIAGILGAFDDKIELLQKQNKTLEDMAKAIFKSWFVDFDVVHAKQKGFPKADIMREYHLTDELYNLFPSSFEDSSLGPIPTGWQVKTVQDLAKVVGGGTPSTKEPTFFAQKGTAIPWLTPKDLSGYSHKYISHGQTDITQEGLNKSSAQLMPPNSIVFSSRAPIGYIAISLENITTNQGFKSLVPQKVQHTEFLYQYLCYHKHTIENLGTGSTFKEVSGSVMKNISLCFPNDSILKVYEERNTVVNKKLKNNLKQIQTLTELRDTLLPPLISGKIRV